MSTAVANTPAAATETAAKYMTFTLSGEHYAMPIDLLDEVVAHLPVAPVPNTPSFVAGLINLRGRIIPVIDLRLKLRMDTPQLTARACILVVRVPVREGTFHIGVIVEAVQQIVNITKSQISAPPNFGVKVSTRFLDGVVKTNDSKALLLINAIKALTVKEIEDLQDAVDTPADDSAAH